MPARARATDGTLRSVRRRRDPDMVTRKSVGRTFVEDFSDGQGGVYGWIGNQAGPKALEYVRRAGPS